MNLDEKIVTKIRELLESGEYENEKDVIIRAIENLYERTQAVNGSTITVNLDHQQVENRFSASNFLAREQDETGRTLNSRLDVGKLYSILEKPDEVNHLCIVPKPEKIYGNAHAGLIWIFHNRFLPVKFIITSLAKLIVETENKWIDIEELKTQISLEVTSFTELLSKMNFTKLGVKPTIGFPSTFEKFYETPKLKKMRRKGRRKDKADELAITSKNRFIDQFVGRELKEKNERRVAGACFEMGLMKAGYFDEVPKLKVTLSKLGEKFVGLDWTKTTNTYNQIFEQIWNQDKIGTPIENIFSKLEVDFIMKEIIPQFELEKIIVKEFLGLHEKTGVPEITEIFLDIQKRYLEQKYLKEYGQINQEKLEKNSIASATTVMTKLVELGKVKRIKHGLSVFYIANS